jgi:hypothetical protein
MLQSKDGIRNTRIESLICVRVCILVPDRKGKAPDRVSCSRTSHLLIIPAIISVSREFLVRSRFIQYHGGLDHAEVTAMHQFNLSLASYVERSLPVGFLQLSLCVEYVLGFGIAAPTDWF